MINPELIWSVDAASMLGICIVRLYQLGKQHNLTVQHIRVNKGGHPKRYYVLKEIEELKKKRETT